LTAYNKALAAVNKDDYTVDSWATYQTIVTAVGVTAESTQGEVDTATAAITAAQSGLVLAGKGNLETAKLNAAALSEEKYTIASWGTLESALAMPEKTNVDAFNKTGAITNAIAALVLKADLTAYNKTLLAVNKDDYTLASWTTYQAVVTAVKVTAESTQESVDTAIAAIKAVQSGLVFTSKGDLEIAKAKVAALAEDNYTAITWANLKKALEMPETTNTEVADKTVAITNATSALVLKTDMIAYNKALAAVNKDDYTETSWTAYQTVVTENVVTAESTQKAIDIATVAITAAQGSLVFASKGDLETAKLNAAALSEEKYTIASWIVLNSALAMPETTNTEVFNKTTAITSAIKALVLKADLTAYNKALVAVNKDDYTGGSWATYQAVVTANNVTVENSQGEVDTATAAITAAQGSLVVAGKGKSIIAFSIGSNVGTINETNHTIAVTVPYGTSVKALTPTITISDKASVSPTSGTTKDFTSPLTYKVTAENGATQNYVVTVTVKAAVATSPIISTQPTGTTVVVGGTASLSVKASVSTGTLSYQWYSSAANSTSGGTAISGATSSSYTVPTPVTGTKYYYCIVKNTVGTSTATTTSSVVAVVITAKATSPIISTQPTGTTVVVGGTANLSVKASVATGTLSYQWYSSTTNSTSGGAAINGATSSSYTVPTTAIGTKYYYCIVKNTVGSSTATTTSSVVAVIITAKATSPIISTQPTNVAAVVGGTANLSVKASVATGTLSYQWYSSTTNSTSSGTAISGATSSSYTVPTTAIGTKYYYCIVKNTVGTSIATTTSSIAIATIKAATATAPTISTQPKSTTALVKGIVSLSIGASVTTGTLSYQWYSSTTNSASGGTAISGATSSSYTVSTTTAGTKYYYCILKDTVGTSTATTTSSVVAVVVVTKAAAPTISTQPKTTTAVIKGTAILSIVATGTGTLSYQWYSNTKSSTSGATAISGATSSTYTVPTTTVGNKYYYCIVTNKVSTSTAVTSSSIVMVTVKA